MAPKREVVLVHSSDLHLGTDSLFGCSFSEPLAALRGVLAAARVVNADLVVLAGDTFEHNRQPPDLVHRAAETMGEFSSPIVILPGNHDPLTADSVYRQPELAAKPNVCVLGLTVDEGVVFPHLDLEVWGRAHLDYADMSPLARPPARSTRWQLALAHGHYVEDGEVRGPFAASWLIRREDLLATGADYVALGHWNRPARVGDGHIHAYYSGSPEYAGTVNVVRLERDGNVEVTLTPCAL